VAATILSARPPLRGRCAVLEDVGPVSRGGPALCRPLLCCKRSCCLVAATCTCCLPITPNHVPLTCAAVSLPCPHPSRVPLLPTPPALQGTATPLTAGAAPPPPAALPLGRVPPLPAQLPATTAALPRESPALVACPRGLLTLLAPQRRRGCGLASKL